MNDVYYGVRVIYMRKLYSPSQLKGKTLLVYWVRHLMLYSSLIIQYTQFSKYLKGILKYPLLLRKTDRPPHLHDN